MAKSASHLKEGLAISILTTCLWLGVPASAQPAQNNRGDERSVQNDDEQARFRQFLDRHREIAEQVRKDPSLCDNRKFLKDHPALETYFQEHPAVREEIRKNPTAFMQQEAGFNRPEDNRGQGITREELASFHQFLDSHREIAEQVRKDPSLCDNREFLRDHPALETYLRDHPAVREELMKNPTAFMQQEASFDRRDDNHDLDNRRRELASFEQFLNSHREIAEQVRKDPSLCDNREFLKDHPALQAYLQDHPAVRDQIRENPNAFMQEEARLGGSEGGMDRDRSDRRRADFGEFLSNHAIIAQRLYQDPSLVKNKEYMDNSPELRDYLNAHPDVQAQLMADPATFVRSAQRFDNNNGATVKTPMGPTTPPKPK